MTLKQVQYQITQLIAQLQAARTDQARFEQLFDRFIALQKVRDNCERAALSEAK